MDVSFHLPRENNTGEQWKRIQTQRTECAEKSEGRVCLTIGKGGNKLGACGNSWNDCFKWIF
jgi:hypothetical protein